MPVTFGDTTNPDLVQVPKLPPSISDGQIDQHSWIDFILKVASVTANYREGSFVGTVTGVTGTVTQTFKYIQMGNLILLSLSVNLRGNSNSTTCTITGLPTALTPTAIQVCQANIISSGTQDTGSIAINTNGTIQVQLRSGSTTFVNDGLLKGLEIGTFCYSLSS